MVRELDALGGLMPRISDMTGLHFRCRVRQWPRRREWMTRGSEDETTESSARPRKEPLEGILEAKRSANAKEIARSTIDVIRGWIKGSWQGVVVGIKRPTFLSR